MIATLWIHRNHASDMLLRFTTAFEAHQFGARFLFEYRTPVEEETFIEKWDEEIYTEGCVIGVGDTPCLQLSVHPGEFHPNGYLGIEEWNEYGTFIVTPEEALELGSTDELLEKCHRTKEELDQELDDYMRQGEIEADISKQEQQDDMSKVSAEFVPVSASCLKLRLDDLMARAKRERLATSAFGYNERLDAPIDWSRWVKPARKNSDD